MADMADHADEASSVQLDADSQSTINNGTTSSVTAAAPGVEPSNRGIKRSRTAGPDPDDDDDEDRRERRKIEIKFINDKSRRHITFSKRKAGIMKKAYELSVLTGTQVLLLVVSETGLVYTFTTPKLQPLVTKPEGKNLIQACLNAPEPVPAADNGVDESNVVDSPDESANPNHIPQQSQPPRMAQNHLAAQGGYIPPGVGIDPTQAMYGNYVGRSTAQYMPQPHPGHQT